MDVIIENKYVFITPKIISLNGEAIVRSRSNKTTTIPSNITGQKYVAPPLDATKSKRKLDKLYDEMYQKLLKPRVKATAECGLAILNSRDKTIEVVRKVNDMSRFGYMSFGQQYLYYYEALFLLEVGRLQIDYHNLPLSIEQAYVLLLSESASLEHSTYLVYKHLTSLGFYLTAYKGDCTKSSEIDYAWLIVEHQMQGTNLPADVRKNSTFKNVLKEMLETKNQLLHMTTNTAIGNLELSQIDPVTNESLSCSQDKSSSIIDYLEKNEAYMNLKASFSAFNYVHAHKATTCHNVEIKTTLKIIFDIFFSLPHKERRPALRIVIIRHNELFPTSLQILQEYGEQIKTTPLLFCHVGNSRQIQAYLYHL